MKKSAHKLGATCLLLVFVLCLGVLLPVPTLTAQANMAQPLEDKGSGILFDKHTSIQVDEEVLNIKFNSPQADKSQAYRWATADIQAIYTMTNTSEQAQTVNAMFLSPVFRQNQSDYSIVVDGVQVEYTTQYFSSGYDYLDTDALLNWEEILANANIENDEYADYAYVSAVSYSFDFAPLQTQTVCISYQYATNINNYGNSERVILNYFLTPAKYWKDFGDLTINLTLDSEYSNLVSSSLRFHRVGKGEYKYQSHGIPQVELEIVAGQTPSVGIVTWIFGTIALLLAITGIYLVVKRPQKIHENEKEKGLESNEQSH